MRCNVQHGTGEGGATTTARLVMRAAGNLRLILNAALFKGIVFTPLDGGKGVSFACVNAAEGGAGGEGGEGAAAGAAMGTFAVLLRGADADARGVTFKTALDKALREVLASQAAAAPAPPAGDEAV